MKGAKMSNLLLDHEVAEMVNVSAYTVRYWRRNNTGPKHILVGRQIRYRKSDIDEWLKDQTVSPGEAGSQ